MGTVITQRWNSITPEQYDQIHALVRWDVDVPTGMTFHVASFEADTLHMLDVWDSAEQFMAFAQIRIMPAVAQLGLDGFPEMVVTSAHDLFSSAATPVAS